MGLIAQVFASLFGQRRNAVVEIAEVFRENAEGAAERGHAIDVATLQQFAAEFAPRSNRTWWDSFVDGLNRLPRPIMALWAVWVLAWTPVDPEFMARVFEAWSIIPQMVWGVILTIVTFFFSGRAQVKDLDFQKDLAGMVQSSRILRQPAVPGDTIGSPGGEGAVHARDNPALADILKSRKAEA